MNCEEVKKSLDAYLDGELDPLANQAIEQHLRDCPKCDQIYQANRSLGRLVGNAMPYDKAPAGLRERIQSSLREAVNENESAGSVTPAREPARTSMPAAQPQSFEPKRSSSEMSWSWLALAAGIVLGAIVAGAFLSRWQQPGPDQFLATQLIASHVRSLMANHLTDVASTDQHTVKPWLDERLDFAPPVIDLSGDGFPLVGGRLDYLDNRTVAALVYQRRKHFINLFVWPAQSKSDRAAETISRQGYHVVHWTQSDFDYWAVSDVNEADLQNFKQLFEQQSSPR